jgi:hypothetical protein
LIEDQPDGGQTRIVPLPSDAVDGMVATVMSYTGRVENGVVVLPPNVKLPEGTQVRVEPLKRQGQKGTGTAGELLLRFAGKANGLPERGEGKFDGLQCVRGVSPASVRGWEDIGAENIHGGFRVKQWHCDRFIHRPDAWRLRK